MNTYSSNFLVAIVPILSGPSATDNMTRRVTAGSGREALQKVLTSEAEAVAHFAANRTEAQATVTNLNTLQTWTTKLVQPGGLVIA